MFDTKFSRHELLALIFQHNNRGNKDDKIHTKNVSSMDEAIAHSLIQHEKERKAKYNNVQQAVVDLVTDLEEIEKIQKQGDADAVDWKRLVDKCRQLERLLDAWGNDVNRKKLERAKAELTEKVSLEGVKRAEKERNVRERAKVKEDARKEQEINARKEAEAAKKARLEQDKRAEKDRNEREKAKAKEEAKKLQQNKAKKTEAGVERNIEEEAAEERAQTLLDWAIAFRNLRNEESAEAEKQRGQQQESKAQVQQSKAQAQPPKRDDTMTPRGKGSEEAKTNVQPSKKECTVLTPPLKTNEQQNQATREAPLSGRGDSRSPNPGRSQEQEPTPAVNMKTWLPNFVNEATRNFIHDLASGGKETDTHFSLKIPDVKGERPKLLQGPNLDGRHGSILPSQNGKSKKVSLSVPEGSQTKQGKSPVHQKIVRRVPTGANLRMQANEGQLGLVSNQMTRDITTDFSQGMAATARALMPSSNSKAIANNSKKGSNESLNNRNQAANETTSSLKNNGSKQSLTDAAKPLEPARLVPAKPNGGELGKKSSQTSLKASSANAKPKKPGILKKRHTTSDLREEPKVDDIVEQIGKATPSHKGRKQEAAYQDGLALASEVRKFGN